MNESQLKVKYQQMNADQLQSEFRNIASDPNARTNIEALTKVSLITEELESRGLSLQSASNGVNTGGNSGMPRAIDDLAPPQNSYGSGSQQSRRSYEEDDSGGGISIWAILAIIFFVVKLILVFAN